MLSILTRSTVFAQELGKIFSKYFSPTEYNFGTQVWDIAQDANGILYFGSQSGLSEFDGTNWTQYSFPNSTIRTVEIAKNGYILAGGLNEFGYYALNPSGKLIYNSLKFRIDSIYRDFGDVWNIETIGDLWFFQTDKFLFRFNKNECKVWQCSGEYFYYSYKLDNEIYIQDFGKGLYKISGQNLNLVSDINLFANKRILSILPYRDRFIVGTRTFGFYIYEPKSGAIYSISEISKNAKSLNEYFIKYEIYSGLLFEANKYIIGTLNSGALIFDDNFNVLDVLNENSCGLNHSIYYMHYTKDGHLWMALENGIQKIELATPIRYWDLEAGINGAATSFIEWNNRYYFSTTRGVFYIDKGNGENRYDIDRFNQIPGISEQAWKLFTLNPNTLRNPRNALSGNNKRLVTYTINKNSLFTSTAKGIYVINNLKPDFLFPYNDIYSVYISEYDSTKIYLGLRNGLARICYINGNWYNDGKLAFFNQETNYLMQDKNQDLWFSGLTNQVFKLRKQYLNDSIYPNLDKIPSQSEFFDHKSGLKGSTRIEILKVQDKLKFSSDSGYFIFDPISKKFKIDPGVGKNFVDTSWKNKVIIELNTKYWINAIEKYKKGDKYIADSLIFKKIYKYLISLAKRDNLNRIWVGASDGIFCYQEKYKKNYYVNYPAIIRKVVLGNDSVIYFGYSFNKGENENTVIQDYTNKFTYRNKIPYNLNSLSFDYTSTSFEGEMKNEYSYILEGYDKIWSSWNAEAKKAYTNLPEGEYVFRLRSRNFYGIESTEANFSFIIASPWYRTIWAYIVYGLVFILFVILVLKIYTRRLIKEKEKLENIVHLRTQEILMQNEEILVQAENLKEANENIKAKNQELQSQKTALEQRTIQLELSNATKNKFFRIIAHDLRGPISSFAATTSHILNDAEERGWEKTKLFLNELYKLSQTTYNLLENLLEWSSSQMGEIRYKPVVLNITNLVNDNIDLILQRLEIKMIKIFSSLPPILEVHADENMLNTVIRNLLSNAVKFTNENGSIKITFVEKVDFYEIKIADTGIGISEQDIEKIFQIDTAFSKPGTQNEKGSGLGLILCKDFIEKNGGILQVESKPGVGSTFSFTVKKASKMPS